MSEKKHLRKIVKAELEQFTASREKSELASAQVCKNLIHLVEERKLSPPFGLSFPLCDEPNLGIFIEKFSQHICYSRIGKNNYLEFASCVKGELVPFSLGNHRSLQVAPTQFPSVLPQTLLVPGLAFSMGGDRLGRGKGFYDRFLEQFSGVCIGLCFDFQIKENVPTVDHDKKVNFIVTDKRIVQI